GALDEIKIYNYPITITEISNLNTLPVRLKDFTAVAEANKVKLHWTTLSEQNNNRFDIEHSKDGKDFTFLTSEKGKGTTSSMSDYTFYDLNPYIGTNYYRLTQYDHDGKSEVLGIKA